MHNSTTSGSHQHGYRGRVRSGCLTCRSRKVKCDETRPVCNNCTRLQRSCTYKPRKDRHTPVDIVNSNNVRLAQSPNDNGAGVSTTSPSVSQVNPSPPYEEACDIDASLEISETAEAIQEPFQYPDLSIVDVTARLQNALQGRREYPPTPDDTQTEADTPSTLISRDIQLTTTMDLLAARGKPMHLFSSYFLETVDCPGITPYDSVNWELMKHHILERGRSCEAVSSAVTAVSALYKAQMYSLSTSRAVSLYASAKNDVWELLGDDSNDYSMVLMATFLLCIFELIHSGDVVPILKEPGDLFLERLADWALQASTHSDISIRLITWLKILHRTTLRGGGLGLISNDVYNLLPNYDGTLPDIKAPAGYQADVSTHLYQALSRPIFDFYYRLQLLSGEIAQLTHYHRSRITGDDQEDVVEHIADIKARLRSLWDSRSATQTQTPKDLHSQLAPKIANPIITLIGICDVAYHAEIVEIDRVLGDPVSRWTDSRESIQAIRDIVDGDWTETERARGGKLNPGYLRPLFMYAIECMDLDQNRWAVERIKQIQSPIYRSDFFSEFGKALSDAQVRKERRVTSKYFCIWYFGVPPPFM